MSLNGLDIMLEISMKRERLDELNFLFAFAK